jgi:hypothetical protein
METCPRCDDISTHSPFPTLRLALRQVTSWYPVSIIDIAFGFLLLIFSLRNYPDRRFILVEFTAARISVDYPAQLLFP